MSAKSVTLWIQALENGDQQASQALFDRYYDRLVGLARKKLRSLPRRMVDEEDIAIMSFYSCLASAQQGRYPHLKNRDELWRLLVTITERKVLDIARKHRSIKRGSGKVRGESVFANPNDDAPGQGINGVPEREPSEEFAGHLADEYTRLMKLLEDDDLIEIADLVLKGHSTAEIATQINRTQRTVQRRIKMIQDIWCSDHEHQQRAAS